MAGAGRLGPQKGGLGFAMQRTGRFAAAIVDGHADARREPDVLAVGVERTHERLADPIGDLLGVSPVVEVGAQDRKLVAGQANQQIVGAEHRVEPFRNRSQHVIAGPVAVVHVHQPEAVDVDDEGADAAAARAVEGGLQAFLEHDAIRQAGQRVTVCPARGVRLVGHDLAPAAVAEEHESEGDEAQQEHRLLEPGGVSGGREQMAGDVEAQRHEQHGRHPGGQASDVGGHAPLPIASSTHAPLRHSMSPAGSQ